MADHVSPDVRSEIMSQIRSRDTTPEKTVRSYLHRRGFRFRLHRADLPGKPDLVLPKYESVVFVHGCFWHQHPDPDCPHTGIPDSNTDYWEPKLKRNVERDEEHRERLKAHGWNVEVIWECNINRERLEELCRAIAENEKPG